MIHPLSGINLSHLSTLLLKTFSGFTGMGIADNACKRFIRGLTWLEDILSLMTTNVTAIVAVEWGGH